MNTRRRQLLQLWLALALIVGVMSFGISRLGAAQSQMKLAAQPVGVTSNIAPTGQLRDQIAEMRVGASGSPMLPASEGLVPAQGDAFAYNGYVGGDTALKPDLHEFAQLQPTMEPIIDLPLLPVPTSVEPIPTIVVPDRPTNPFVSTGQDPLSTFALDVDTGSYTAVRNYILAGQLPPSSNVRPEEFVNYFRYDYPVPEESTFGIYVDSAPSPYSGANTHFVRVGIQGQRVSDTQRKDAVLTFVIDISGSMAEPNRLPLVKQALRLLVNELRPSDQVGIVVYGSDAAVVLDHTGVSDKDAILKAIDGLQNEGSTNAEAGLRAGYELASKHLKEGAINRVILCSDGVANVGEVTPDGIRQAIRDYTKQGIVLTTVGFGMGDYNDYLMEQLADDGDGSYAYVDTLAAAKRIFVENLTGTLQVIAKDAKVQVDFNPAVVSRYRLVGYENRDVADNDFRNDAVDAGEIGAGHTVTALYEVELVGQTSGNALTVQMRYADPSTKEVKEIKQPFERNAFGNDFASSKPRFQLAVAVASFAEQLRGGNLAQGKSLSDVQTMTQSIASQLQKDADVQEFAALVAKAGELQKQFQP
jgi:Ca-activated chloride channel family protein